MNWLNFIEFIKTESVWNINNLLNAANGNLILKQDDKN